MGINFNDLRDDLNIPEFIKENNATLRFPAKVSLSCDNDGHVRHYCLHVGRKKVRAHIGIRSFTT